MWRRSGEGSVRVETNACSCVGFAVWRWTGRGDVRRLTGTSCTSAVQHLKGRCWKAEVAPLSVALFLYSCTYFFQLCDINHFYWLVPVTDWLCTTSLEWHGRHNSTAAVEPIGLSVNADTQGRLERKWDTTHGCSTGRTEQFWHGGKKKCSQTFLSVSGLLQKKCLRLLAPWLGLADRSNSLIFFLFHQEIRIWILLEVRGVQI